MSGRARGSAPHPGFRTTVLVRNQQLLDNANDDDDELLSIIRLRNLIWYNIHGVLHLLYVRWSKP